MEDLQFLEYSLRSLENLIHLEITVIDQDGLFRFRQRQPLFTAYRSSHRKYPICNCGFSERCIKHCRYDMNELAQRKKQPFVSTCWKGLVQLVIPLRDHLIHYGMFYVGLWKNPDRKPNWKDLPNDFKQLYEELPVFTELQIQELLGVLHIYSEGILCFLKRRSIFSEDFRKIQIQNFLLNHIPDSIGLPDLAQELKLSNSYTSTLLKQLFGITFSALLMHYRVERVKHYLESSDMKLKEIFPLCGFSSEFHLSRVFKQQTGITPVHYRRIVGQRFSLLFSRNNQEKI